MSWLLAETSDVVHCVESICATVLILGGAALLIWFFKDSEQ